MRAPLRCRRHTRVTAIAIAAAITIMPVPKCLTSHRQFCRGDILSRLLHICIRGLGISCRCISTLPRRNVIINCFINHSIDISFTDSHTLSLTLSRPALSFRQSSPACVFFYYRPIVDYTTFAYIVAFIPFIIHQIISISSHYITLRGVLYQDFCC